MALQPFRFKQFSVEHDRCTHKVGTDAVLLGSWVNIAETDQHMLDIGTGSGVIALMLAQRSANHTHIDAIDIDEHNAEQARMNAGNSPWPEKITVHSAAAQIFSPETRYNLIVSNPPYFSKSLLPPDSKRSVARHTADLSFKDLLETVVRLLTPGGRFAVVLPYSEGMNLINLAKGHKLFPIRQTDFHARLHKPIERLLLEFSFENIPLQYSKLTLYDQGEKWSDAYQSLTRDFYLRL
jgi:tRNA1Val (adenine37-N6)-methyltransferase